MVLRPPDSWLNWNLEVLFFEERGKPEYPGEKPLGAREKTNTGLSKVASCQQKSPPTWLVLASYSKISLDWPLTWTTQLSTSKLSDNPATTKLIRPTYGIDTEIWTQAAFVGGERSYHYTILAPRKAVVSAIFEISFQKNEVSFQSVSFIYVYVYR